MYNLTGTPYYTPKDMLVEITNKCNYKCIFCTHAKMENKFGDIDVEFFKRISQEAYDMGVRRIGLYTIGEMFLCKEVATHIRNAKQTGYEYIYSDTNGLLATEENLKMVIEAGLHSIKFSINAGTQETYKLVHGQDAFDKVIENLKACYELKQKINQKLRIMVSYVVTKQNEKEIEQLKRIVAPYITDNVIVHAVAPAYMWRYNINAEHLIPETMKYDKVLIPCKMVFNRVHITYNGYLTACCQDFHYDLLLADLKQSSLQDAWYGEKAMALREAHVKHDLKGILCNNCYINNFEEYDPLKM
jgi:MoaA/NifB/PqqE/SkfB family radical SAM enzyme